MPRLMTSLRLCFPAAIAGALLLLCIPAGAPGLTIQFNYDYDSSGFFNPAVSPNGAQARATLENAGRNFEMFTDGLEAIVPSGNNTWSADFTNPSTGVDVILQNLVIPADTMIVYVGARTLVGSTLGKGGPGGLGASGTQEWVDTVKGRGQAGALLTPEQDFARWGGMISFDVDSDWHYGLAAGPTSNDDNDFFSTCLHELCHVLGFGTTQSWYEWINTSNATFTGAASEAVYGGPVPLAGSSHWGFDTESLSGGQAQEAAMDPDLLQGSRKRLTLLDVAGLDDLGWDMPDAGDADLDGDLDAADYITLKRNFGQPATWTGGNFDFDGDVTWRDLAALQANFPNSPAAGAPVPEPATLVLLAAGGVAFLRKRRCPQG